MAWLSVLVAGALLLCNHLLANANDTASAKLIPPNASASLASATLPVKQSINPGGVNGRLETAGGNKKTNPATLLPANLSGNVVDTGCEWQPNAPDKHLVVKGDTLWKLSLMYIKKGSCWPYVFLNNKANLLDPQRLVPGQILNVKNWSDRQNPPASPDISVYRAQLEPQLQRGSDAPNRPVLLAQKPTTLRFSIGPSNSSSVIAVMPAREILESKENLQLSVTLSCDFCEPMSGATTQMFYTASSKQSTEIKFQFIPRKRQESQEGVEQLQLTVTDDRTGREFDRISLFVKVASEGVPRVLTANEVSAFHPAEQVDTANWQADVILYINDTTNEQVSIEVQPVSLSMRTLLNPLALHSDGRRRRFQSTVDDPQLLEAMAHSGYGAMSAVSLQERSGDLLKYLRASGGNASVSEESRESSALSPDEAKNINNLIADIGQSLYGNLFYSEEAPDLATLIEQIETAAANSAPAKPLRLMVVTNRLSLPWQYLHPSGPEIDANKFWGMRFSLTVLRANNQARQRAISSKESGAKKIVFAQYGEDGDRTISLAKVQQAKLLAMPMSNEDLLTAQTGSEFLQKLADERKNIVGIITFLHATAGSADYEPFLEFSSGSIVRSSDLSRLINRMAPLEREKSLNYFTRGPLVILNACETGPAHNLPHVKLQNALFQLGAQGIVVTEAPIWTDLGHQVATKLIDRLNRGEPVSDALTAVRRELYQVNNNPLGLLYAYYGNPAATLGPWASSH